MLLTGKTADGRVTGRPGTGAGVVPGKRLKQIADGRHAVQTCDGNWWRRRVNGWQRWQRSERQVLWSMMIQSIARRRRRRAPPSPARPFHAAPPLSDDYQTPQSLLLPTMLVRGGLPLAPRTANCPTLPDSSWGQAGGVGRRMRELLLLGPITAIWVKRACPWPARCGPCSLNTPVRKATGQWLSHVFNIVIATATMMCKARAPLLGRMTFRLLYLAASARMPLPRHRRCANFTLKHHHPGNWSGYEPLARLASHPRYS